jgi:hypothetical protein
MQRDDLVLTALAGGGSNVAFTPVQVQKLFFLLDREGAHLVEGPHFSFEPYDYGPFDKAVYECLDNLSNRGLVAILSNGRYRSYALTAQGYEVGRQMLSSLPLPSRNYISELATWVRGLSFQQLVSSIYNRYPDMKVNSVFQE